MLTWIVWAQATNAEPSLGANQPHLLSLSASAGPPSIDQILSILPHPNEASRLPYYPQTLPSLILVPSVHTSTQLDALVSHFVTEEITHLPIVHVPSFRARYATFDRTTARDEPGFVALLLAMAGWGTHWRTTDPRATRTSAVVKEGTVRAYLGSAMEALHAAG